MVQRETKVCLTCWALVAAEMADAHDQWHDNIAAVAIENTSRTQRIDALIRDIYPEWRSTP